MKQGTTKIEIITKDGNHQVILSDNIESDKIISDILESLSGLGYSFTHHKTAHKKQKSRHKWQKQFSEIDFIVDYNGSKAVVNWQKRNQFIIKKGAKLRESPPLNADGTVGFSARLSQEIRQENAKDINNFETINDVKLKSVNEVGMFLYFGNANGWLVLKDAHGKTINEYSKV